MVPSAFFAHGSPMIAIEDSDYTRFLGEWGRRCRPGAVLVFTAHWERNVTTITCTDDVYGMIYDFGGFPDELYRVVYPARGSTRVAKRAEELLRSADIPVRLDESRGLDHGTWTLLCRIFPEADIPVVQASVNPFLPPADQYRIGQALRELGRENVLVIGSGATVHNLSALRWGQREPERWAVEFDEWLIGKITGGDLETLFQYETLAPHARLAVPRPEHFVPLFLALGSGNGEPKVLFRQYDYGTLSYLSFEF
ncbi:MAG: dioxygenase [Paenibacillaceae bacterium ZCTH02-B3]|nr:MAG: dioxygenase [Paenibacillaceae bacterium ZCTH02-B3]